jgi:hypothetical protein
MWRDARLSTGIRARPPLGLPVVTHRARLSGTILENSFRAKKKRLTRRRLKSRP